MDKTLERILSLLPLNDKGKIAHGAKANLARSLGYKDGTIVSMWINGSSESYLNCLYEIAKLYNVSVEWLLGETDDPRPSGAVAPSELEKKYRALDGHGRKLVDAVLDLEYKRCAWGTEELLDDQPITMIRHYLVPSAAGYAAPIEGEDFEEIPLPKGAPEGADFCITIRGDSMEPYIKDGSLVYVRRGVQLQEFDVGIFFVDGDVFCKQLCVDDDGALHLLSANPKREDANITIPRDDGRSCVCFGKVLLRERLPRPAYDRGG